MGKLSIRAQTLWDIIEFIVVKNLIYIINVGNLLGAAQILLNTSVCTSERNPINALNVGRPSVRTDTLLVTREFIRERHPLNVATVGRPSVGAKLFSNIRNFILERNLGNVSLHTGLIGNRNLISVGRAWWRPHIIELKIFFNHGKALGHYGFFSASELTLDSDPQDVITWECFRGLLSLLKSLDQKWFWQQPKN